VITGARIAPSSMSTRVGPMPCSWALCIEFRGFLGLFLLFFVVVCLSAGAPPLRRRGCHCLAPALLAPPRGDLARGRPRTAAGEEAGINCCARGARAPARAQLPSMRSAAPLPHSSPPPCVCLSLSRRNPPHPLD
jgi:hypothetical protein